MFRSLKHKIWKEKHANEHIMGHLKQWHDLPAIAQKILATRIDNDATPRDIDNHINPSIKHLMPNPSSLQDMDKGVAIMASAIMASKKIAIFGDYDVDGATSSALLGRYFHAIGKEHTRDYIIYIPDRKTEGYGPSITAFEYLHQQNVDVIITVDCGISGHEACDYAAAHNMKVIVIDHHIGQPPYPNAQAIINPKRHDDTSGCGYLAAVGVAFMALVALNNVLEAQGYFTTISKPDLRHYTDIVAIGTVADLVPLHDFNRALVRAGLKYIAQAPPIYMQALFNTVLKQQPLTPNAISFTVAPRINACGRVGESSLGSQFLLTQDYDQACIMAQRLNDYNMMRKDMEQTIQHHAKQQAEALIATMDEPFLLLGDASYHAGINGIVASRIKDDYNLPTAIIAWEGDIGKASVRSVVNFDVGALIIEARDKKLLMQGGGHAMAAGFTVHKNNYEAFCKFIQDAWQRSKNNLPVLYNYIDSVVDASHISVELAQDISILEPFGQTNPYPIIMAKDCRINYVSLLKGQHVMLNFSGHGPKKARAISFNSANKDFGQALLALAQHDYCHLIGSIYHQYYNDKPDYSFIIEDAIIA